MISKCSFIIYRNLFFIIIMHCIDRHTAPISSTSFDECVNIEGRRFSVQSLPSDQSCCSDSTDSPISTSNILSNTDKSTCHQGSDQPCCDQQTPSPLNLTKTPEQQRCSSFVSPSVLGDQNNNTIGHAHHGSSMFQTSTLRVPPMGNHYTFDSQQNEITNPQTPTVFLANRKGSNFTAVPSLPNGYQFVPHEAHQIQQNSHFSRYPLNYRYHPYPSNVHGSNLLNSQPHHLPNGIQAPLHHQTRCYKAPTQPYPSHSSNVPYSSTERVLPNQFNVQPRIVGHNTHSIIKDMLTFPPRTSTLHYKPNNAPIAQSLPPANQQRFVQSFPRFPVLPHQGPSFHHRQKTDKFSRKSPSNVTVTSYGFYVPQHVPGYQIRRSRLEGSVIAPSACITMKKPCYNQKDFMHPELVASGIPELKKVKSASEEKQDFLRRTLGDATYAVSISGTVRFVEDEDVSLRRDTMRVSSDN